MELQTMYPAKLGSPQTILAASLAADATAMALNDASVLPAAPNIAVIGSDENCEIVSYSAISDNTVTLSARGLGGSTAKAWQAGTTVARNHTSLDHNTMKANIEALGSGKQDSADLADVATSGDAADVAYDNTTSGMTADDVQNAIDELNTAIDAVDDKVDGIIQESAFTVTESSGLWYLNWYGAAATCPYSVSLVGTDYILSFEY